MTKQAMLAFDDDTRFVVASDPTSADMPGETVILDPKSGRYYGLDGVGSRVWNLLSTPHSLKKLLETVASEYDVTVERCEMDLRALLIRLVDAGLVEVDGPRSGG